MQLAAGVCLVAEGLGFQADGLERPRSYLVNMTPAMHLREEEGKIGRRRRQQSQVAGRGRRLYREREKEWQSTRSILDVVIGEVV